MILNLLHCRLGIERMLNRPEWSIRGMCGTDLRGYFGARGSRRVLGRWNVTEVRTLRTEWEDVPLRTAFLAAFAFASAGLAEAGAVSGWHVELST